MKNKDKQRGLIDLQDVIYIIGGRWRGAILASLCDKPKRFNELKRDIGRITPKSLINELKFLEMNKLLIKTETENSNFAIYQLTEHGYSLQPLIFKIIEWAQKHREVVLREE